MRVGDEANSFRLHQIKTAVDDAFLQLEFRDAITQQSADTVGLFVYRDPVSGAVELLGRRQACGAGADDRNFSSGAEFGRLGSDPAFEKSALDDVLLDVLYRNWRLVDAQHAGGFAWRGTDASSELGEVVGSVQLTNRFFPAPAIHEVVPVRNNIIYWASGVAERHAAIHAAAALGAQFVFGEILIDLEPVVDPFGHRTALRHLALRLHKSGGLTHGSPLRVRRPPAETALECNGSGCGSRSKLA